MRAQNESSKQKFQGDEFNRRHQNIDLFVKFNNNPTFLKGKKVNLFSE